MRVARRQERPFLPSPGQFVAWCKQSGGALGITVDQVITEYWDWRNRSFEFTSSEHFPWSQPVMYHICVELRHRSIERQLTHGELACEAGDLLDMWRSASVRANQSLRSENKSRLRATCPGRLPLSFCLSNTKRVKQSDLFNHEQEIHVDLSGSALDVRG